MIAAGQTIFLIPREPATMFPGATLTSMRDVTDGPSNTIMTLEAHTSTGTRPDDRDLTAGAWI